MWKWTWGRNTSVSNLECLSIGLGGLLEGGLGLFSFVGVLSYVIDNLVRDAAVVLQDVVVLAADGAGDARGNG